MKRGVIGVPKSGWLQSVEDTDDERLDEYGNQREAALTVTEQQSLTGGTEFYVGEAYRERSTEEQGYTYEGGTIRTAREIRKKVDHTDYALVPSPNDDNPADAAHTGYMVVSASAGTFAFGMAGRQNSGVVRRARIRTGDFLSDRREEVDVKTAGGVTGSPHAGKVTAWGDDVLEDPEIDDLLGRNAHGDLLNQIAVSYVWDGVPHYVYLARSGYVEIYNPNDATTAQFLRFVRQEVLPYTDATGENETLDADRGSKGGDDDGGDA